MVFRNVKSNVLAVTIDLLKKLRVKANRSTVQHLLESHPDYPSLLSISDCLSEFNITSISYRQNALQFDSLANDRPLITHCPKNGGTFYQLNKNSDGTIQLSNEKEHLEITASDFINSCGGLILVPKANLDSAEPDFELNRLRQFFSVLVQPFFMFSIVLALTYLFQLQPFSWTILLLLLLEATGLLICIEMLRNKFGHVNPYIQQICIWIRNSSCNSLSTSNKGQPFEWLNWAELGFIYFAGSFLTVLLLPYLAPFLAWLNVLALPFTAYLVGYQILAKKWCVLCSAIQLLIGLELISFLSTSGIYDLSTIFSWGALIPLALCFMLPISIYAMLVPILQKASYLKPIQQQLNQVKSDKDLFKFSLTNQEFYFINEDIKPILLGDTNAKTVITMIGNPFCEPCSNAHLKLDDWMQQNDNLKLRLVFATENIEDDPQTQVARHMIALSMMEDSLKVQRALREWFKQSKKDYKQWAKKYPVIIINKAKAACGRQKEWCQMAGIYYTPTILINGYPIPKPYQFDDLKYLLRQD